jgi:hypothetical protein
MEEPIVGHVAHPNTPCHLAATGHDLAETTAYHAGAKIFRVPALPT